MQFLTTSEARLSNWHGNPIELTRQMKVLQRVVGHRRATAAMNGYLQRQRDMAKAEALQRQAIEDDDELQMQPAPEALQRQVPEEGKLLQGKIEPVQRQDLEDDDLLQVRFAESETPTQRQDVENGRENRTGMPDSLKFGLEELSGLDLSDVRVHYNSPRPADVNALAFAQGQDIHLGPGQEQHLPHEGWHAVQQMQGRVRPTMQAFGVAINDDDRLEREADLMGGYAALGGDAIQRQSNHRKWSALQDHTMQRKVGFEIEVPVVNLSLQSEQKLSKGETLDRGLGWRLTPDNFVDDRWTPEYIVAAVEENQDDKELLKPIQEVQEHATHKLFEPSSWSHSEADAMQTEFGIGDDVVGNFHVTGGLRLSRIGQLISILYPEDNRDLGAQTPEVERARGETGSNYNAVVSLIATQIRNLKEAGKLGNLDGKSAKQAVSILSRVDLHDVVAKARSIFKTRNAFCVDVSRAAGVGLDDKLFHHKLPGKGEGRRTIDDEQDLTVGQWLSRIFNQADYVWSETKNDQNQNFTFEAVGPSRTVLGRAQGVVLELRALAEQGIHSPYVEDWDKVALRYMRLFRMLNAKEDKTSIINAFHGKPSEDLGADANGKVKAELYDETDSEEGLLDFSGKRVEH